MNTVTIATCVVIQNGRRVSLLYGHGTQTPEDDRHTPQRVGSTDRDLLWAERIDTVLPLDVHVSAEAEHHTVVLWKVNAAAILSVQEGQLSG